ncbi:MAG: PfkB family carbohydrate kinase [Candidatus Jordarchaeales archaeon]|nr:hypothetical protein [Candidatus Jordarchaeia archaeon]
MARYDLTVIGHLTLDTISFQGQRWLMGGSPFYGGLTACKLGAKVAVVSKVASGSHRLMFSSLLNSAGVSAFILGGRATTCFEINYGASGRRLKLLSRADDLSFGEVPLEALDASAVLLSPVAGELNHEFVENTSSHCMRRGNLLAADLQGFTRTFSEDGDMAFKRPEKRFLSSFDVIKGSEREVKSIVECDYIDEALIQIAQLGPKVVIATLGEKGALAFYKDEFFRVYPLKPVMVVDPTGAGDAFIAAFLIGYAWSMSLEDCLKLACSAATCVVERKLPLGDASKEYILERSKEVRIERTNNFSNL